MKRYLSLLLRSVAIVSKSCSPCISCAYYYNRILRRLADLATRTTYVDCYSQQRRRSCNLVRNVAIFRHHQSHHKADSIFFLYFLFKNHANQSGAVVVYSMGSFKAELLANIRAVVL